MSSSISSERYASLRDAQLRETGPFYVPAEAMWTKYSDQVMHFSLAHELIHITEGDIKKPGRATGEEMGADIGAVNLLHSMTLSTAQRQGYRPSISGFTMGPIVFFGLSRVFAYLDDFDKKYLERELDKASMAEAMTEEMTLMKRSLSLAGFLALTRWISEPSAAVFWNITGELRLLEIALRCRIWEVSGTPLTLPLETEIHLEQKLIRDYQKRTERDVLKFWESQRKLQTYSRNITTILLRSLLLAEAAVLCLSWFLVVRP